MLWVRACLVGEVARYADGLSALEGLMADAGLLTHPTAGPIPSYQNIARKREQVTILLLLAAVLDLYRKALTGTLRARGCAFTRVYACMCMCACIHTHTCRVCEALVLHTVHDGSTQKKAHFQQHGL